MNEIDKSIPRIMIQHVFFKFPGELENQFYDHYFQISLLISRVALILFFVFYVLFGILNYFTLPQIKKIYWIIPYLIICAIIFIIFIFTFTPAFRKYMQLLLILTALFGSLGIMTMIIYAHQHEYGTVYYYIGLIIVILWVYTFSRITFVNACIVSFFITTCFEIIFFYDINSQFPLLLSFIIINYFYLSAQLLGILSSFFLEYYLRNEFLIRKKLLLTNKIIINEKKRKASFFTKIAYDTKTPLTLIKNYLSHYFKESDLNPRLYLIRKNINKLCRDISNFLDIDKLEKGIKIYNHNQVFNISNMIVKILMLYNENIERKNIYISSNIEKNIYIKADPSAIDRVIHNIMDNALKYNNPKGKVLLSLYYKGNFLSLEISDTGIGIPQIDIDKIFNPYFQVNNTENNSHGIGMGLYIVKKIIESLDGDITVKSNINKGTKIIITFNRYFKTIERISNNLKVTKPLDTSPVIGSIKNPCYDPDKNIILVVDDNKDMIYFLKLELQEEYNFYYAFNGIDALKQLAAIPRPDLIISDVIMNNMNGYELLENIKNDKRLKTIPFIFLTVETTNEDKLKGLSSGALSYIYKPFSINELKAKIKSLVKNKNSIVSDLKERIFNAIYTDNKENYSRLEKYKLYINKICLQHRLSKREKDVLLLLMKSNSYKAIGDELFISIHTVKSHVQKLYKKLNISGRNQLIGLFKEY